LAGPVRSSGDSGKFKSRAELSCLRQSHDFADGQPHETGVFSSSGMPYRSFELTAEHAMNLTSVFPIT
jgi:hypothetical protein